MMDFVDSLKRGVDRAGFELDRLLRANRVRSQINALRSQMDEEERQIGRQVVDLYDSGDLVQEQLRERCERVKQYRAEIAKREAELDAINREVQPPSPEEPFEMTRPPAARCPDCGAELPEGAIFCPRCGSRLESVSKSPTPSSGQGTARRIPVELETGEQEEPKQDRQDEQDDTADG